MSICLTFAVSENLVARTNTQNQLSALAAKLKCINTSTQLKPGDKVQRDVGGGECHSYQIALAANHFLHVVIEQRGIDVVLTIYKQDGTQLSQVDRPNGSRGPETISLIAPVDGFYLLTVRSLEEVSARGKYDLTLRPPRLTVADDAKQVDAERLVSEGEQLRGSAQSIQAAIPKFQQAADVWHSLGNSYEEALALYGAGFSSMSLGDNQTAINYLRRALPVFMQLKSTSAVAMVTTALGWTYLYLADLENAFESFNDALEIHRAEKNVRGEGITLYGLGWVHAVRGEDHQALRKFSESLSCRRQAMDRHGEALTLTGIGKIETRLGHHARALKDLQLALELLPKKKRYAEADILSNLGWVYRALNENDKAMSFFTTALAIRREIGDSIGEATTRYGLSMVQRSSRHLREAESEIEAALNIIESLRVKGSNQQLRISYFASVQQYYEYYITLLIELDQLHPSAGYVAKALHVCERARARGLLDLLAEAKVDLRHGIDPRLVDQERAISENLNALALQRQQDEKKSGYGKSDKEIYRLHNELEATRAEIRRLNPQYAALTQLQPLTANEIQKQVLDNDTLLLQYVLSEERSFVLAVSSDQITTHELPPAIQIESVARQFYEATTLRNRLDWQASAEQTRAKIFRADAEADKLGHDLTRMLIEPVRNRLTKQRLVIVATGALQFIPFAALPAPLRPASELNVRQVRHYHTPVPLIEDHEIIVLPSVTALSAIRQEVKTRTPPPKTVIIFGDPVYEVTDARVRATVERPTSRNEFPRLIGSRWEAKQILSLVPQGEGRLVVDFAANEAFASSAEVHQYRFVHFATHAIIDFEHPALSAIILSMLEENGKPRDGSFTLEDIFRLKMPVDLVVLSGCRTALGKDYAGEGLVGLTRAFMYAGASRVAVSLWQVADKPTSELMVRFYKHMLGPDKLSPAAALRAAQLELQKDPRWRSPYFWAPFILQGDWR